MEHRWYPRKKCVRRAMLYLAGKSLCPCRIENISLDGLYIRTPEIQIDNGSCVDVVLDGAPVWNTHAHSKAVVVYKRTGGIGLMCLGINPIYSLLTQKHTTQESAAEIV